MAVLPSAPSQIPQHEIAGADAHGQERAGLPLRLHQWGLPAVVAALLLVHLDSYQSLSIHEAYAAVPAREMMESGDWVVPRFAGVARLEKPPWVYWSVAASATLWGGLNEWSARFPSVMAGLLLAALMGLWAKRWYGSAAGWAAFLIQGTSLSALTFSRKAIVDMQLCLMMTAAMFLIAHQPADEPQRRAFLRWLGIYTLLGGTWLAKFHFGLGMVMAPALMFFVWQKQWWRIRHLWNPAGLLIFSACAVLWFVLVWQRLPGATEVWWEETVGRSVGIVKHQRPFWYYLPELLGQSLPWTPFVLWGMGNGLRRAWKAASERDRFLVCWLAGQLFLLTVTPSKHVNYLLPTLPAASLWGATGLVRWLEKLRNDPQAMNVWWLLLAVGGTVAGGIVAALVIVHKWPHFLQEGWLLGGALMLGGTATAWCAYRRQLTRLSVSALATFLCCYLLLGATILPQQDPRLVHRLFALQVRRQVSRSETITLYELAANPVAFYLRSPVQRADTFPLLAEHLQREGRLEVLLREPQLSRLKTLGRTDVLLREETPANVRPPKQGRLLVVRLWSPSLPSRRIRIH